jgi:hypothetical protein
MRAAGDEAGKVGHVDYEDRADLVGDLAETLEIDDARIGKPPAMMTLGRLSRASRASSSMSIRWSSRRTL